MILRRLFSLLLALWMIASLSFLAIYRLPGDPARIILGPQASASEVATFRSNMGLDKSMWVQYATYMRRLVRLDLGHSYSQRRPVSVLLRERGSATMVLAATASLFVLIGGILLPLGLRLTGGERLMGFIEAILQILAVAPPYVLAIGGLILFAGKLGWIQVVFDPTNPRAWIVPAMALGAYPTVLVMRLFSKRLEEESHLGYAQRARALGMPTTYIVFREILPNALPAALAALANTLAFFVTGAFFVEAVFGIPGLGGLAQESLRTKDISTLSGLCLTFAAVVIVLSAILDMAQQALAPKGFSQ